MKLRPPMGR